MTKRPLTVEEVDLITKQKVILNNDNETNSYNLEYSELMVNKGIDQEYKRKMREWSTKLKEFKAKLDENKMLLDILDDQLLNGVEEKVETESK